MPKLHRFTKSTVWASWDPKAPDLMSYLGDRGRSSRSGAGLPRRAGTAAVRGHRCAASGSCPRTGNSRPRNFLGDTYHNPSHNSVGGHDRHRASPRSARCYGGATTNMPRASTSGSVSCKATAYTACICGTIRLPAGLRAIPRGRRIFSETRFTSASAGLGRDGFCRLPAICSPTPPGAGRQPRALCASGIRTKHDRKPRPGASSWSTPTLRPRCQGRAAALLHALLRARRHDRAGRHGKLAVRDAGLNEGTISAALSVQLSDVDGRLQSGRPGSAAWVSTQITDQTPRNYYRVYAPGI